MKIIKDKKIVDDNWSHLADDEAISQGDITVSLSRWKDEKSSLRDHAGKIGIRLAPADHLEDIADDLANFQHIGLEFPAFTDGRSFSHARLLRSRYQYEDEIRAMGHYMADQVFYLARVGVNAFQLENTAELEVALSTINDFSVQYQASTN